MQPGPGDANDAVAALYRPATQRKDANAVTRELKLALIVGFALVLLVTVLISDHLSKARKAQLAGNVTEAPTGVVTPPNEPAPGPVVTITQGTGGGIVSQPTSPVLIGPGPTDPNAALVMKDPAKDAALTNQIVGRGGEPAPIMPPLVSTGTASMNNGLPANLLPGTPASGQTPDSAVMNEPKPLLPAGFDTGSQQPSNATTPLGTVPPVFPEPAAKKDEATKPATQADERWHTVASGESAFSIAKKYYGKGEMWTKLKDANADRMGDKGQLRVGVKIRIPDAPAKAAKPDSNLNTGKPKETRIAEKADPKPAKPSGPRSYTVQKGDTLGIISQKQLGSSKRVDDILRLNKEIRNPNALQVGAKIMLPAA